MLNEVKFHISALPLEAPLSLDACVSIEDGTVDQG